MISFNNAHTYPLPALAGRGRDPLPCNGRVRGLSPMSLPGKQVEMPKQFCNMPLALPAAVRRAPSLSPLKRGEGKSASHQMRMTT